MLWFWKRKPRGDIVDLDGFAYPLDLLTRGLLITGGVGMGKSVASERFLAAAVRSEWPILGTAVKPDERIRYERLCDAIGVACRLTLVRPGGPWTIDLLGYLLAMPGGSPRAAAQFLGRLNDVLTRSEAGSRQDEAFWKTLFEETLLRAIELCVLATGSATIPAVYEVVISMPRSPKEAGSKGFLERSACGRRLAEARKRIEPTNRTFRQVVEFFITKIPTLGMKARGAAVQMATGVLSGFLADPFYDALCVTTTLTPEQIEAERRIVVLDYPTLDVPTRLGHALPDALPPPRCGPQ